MNNVIVIGDIHRNFKSFNTFYNQLDNKPEIILQCGDFGYYPRTNPDDNKIIVGNTKLYFCDGNHEDFWSLKSLSNNEVYPNVFWMKRGTVLTLPDGKNVMFIGGAYSIDKINRYIGHTWFPEEDITQSDVDYVLSNDKKIDVVISHTCPAEFEVIDNHGYDFNRRALSYIFHILKPTEWYFGHFHIYSEGEYSNCKWTCLPSIHEGSGVYKVI